MAGKKKELLEQPVPETVLEEQEVEQAEETGAEEPDLNELLAAMDEGEESEVELAAVQEDSEQPKVKKTSRKKVCPKKRKKQRGRIQSFWQRQKRIWKRCRRKQWNCFRRVYWLKQR